MKKTCWITILVVVTLLMFLVSSVYAGTNTTDSDFKIWPAKTTNEVNKVWTISFNAALLSTSVNNNTIYVNNSKQTKVATSCKLSADGLSVTVTPSAAYIAGDYNLYITNGLMSSNGARLNEMIIVPFTVVAPSSYTSSVNLVVTVTDDFNAPYESDLSGFLYLEGTNSNRLGPTSKDLSAGKYTFSIYTSDQYYLNLFSANNGVISTRSVKLPAIKVPEIKIPKNGTISTKPTVKTAKITISSKAGVDSGKSGAIGGSVIPEKWGVSVKISNSTTIWTTCTDIDGNFLVYLPAGSYQVDVEGSEVQYKNHRYKLTAAAGQMASPLEQINVIEPIGKLGLSLEEPVSDTDAGLLEGIDATTKQIAGTVSSDSMIELYDIALEIPKKLATAKPDKVGKFIVKLPNTLTGMRLQLKVIDPSGNEYILSMPAPVS